MSTAADIAVIEHALTLFHNDDHGLYIQSDLYELGTTLRIGGNDGASVINRITQDIWNISILLHRLDWMRSLTLQGHLHQGDWQSYSSLDIENFFVQVRSVMDHVAELLRVTLPKGKQLPESFRRLRESMTKYSTRLPAIVIDLVIEASWFDQMRDTRDALVHQGGYSLIFGEPHDGVLFQVFGKRHNNCICHPVAMFNANVVHFDLYAALMMANVLTFLDRLGVAIALSFPSTSKPGPTRCYYSGFQLLLHWMRQTLSKLKNNQPGAGGNP